LESDFTDESLNMRALDEFKVLLFDVVGCKLSD